MGSLPRKMGPKKGASEGGKASSLYLYNRTKTLQAIDKGDYAGFYRPESLSGELSFGNLLSLAKHDGLKERVRKISRHRNRNVGPVEYLRKIGKDSLAQKLSECGSFTQFRHWPTKGVCRCIRANHCKKFVLCSFCASARAAKFVRAYKGRISALKASGMYIPGLVHLVLSSANVGDCGASVGAINEAFKRLTHVARNYKASGRGSSVFAPVLGGVRVLEVKRGKNSKLWHSHWHALLITKHMIDPHELHKVWRECTGVDNVATPNLQWCRPKKGESFEHMLLEVFKYVVKPESLSPADMYEAYQAVRGKQLVKPWGCLHGVKVPDDLGEDLLPDDLFYIDYFLNWSGGNYRVDSLRFRER